MTLPQLCSFIVLQQNYKGFACQILFPCCFKQTNSNVCVAHIKFEASRGRSLSNTNRIVSTMEPIPWLRRPPIHHHPHFHFLSWGNLVERLKSDSQSLPKAKSPPPFFTHRLYFWNFTSTKIFMQKTIFIGPESDHCLVLSLRDVEFCSN